MSIIPDENRRKFLRKLIAGTSAMGIAPYLALQSCDKDDDPVFLEMPKRPLGNTSKSKDL